MEIPCVFKEHTYIDGKTVYICEFSDQNIPEDVQIVPEGQHELDEQNNEKTNADIVGVLFNRCDITKVPQRLYAIFPNFRILSVWYSTLRKVTKNDLAEYKNIEKIGLCDNKIKFIPDDLFEGFKNLDEIGLFGNEIELFGPNFLNGLDKLENVDISRNPRYNVIFSVIPGRETDLTLEGLKEILRNQFENFNSNIEMLPNFPNDIPFDMKKFLKTDETFKDFRIKINDREFFVHKLLLVARSPTLAEILKNNPEVENLNLSDIPEDIFEKILHFLYTDEFPFDDKTNFLTLFATAGKLKIERLKDFAAKKIITMIESFNALNIFKLSSKYEHAGLRQIAFETIKDDYPKIEFKDEWIENVETVIKIIDGFHLMEETIKKAKDEFKSLVLNN